MSRGTNAPRLPTRKSRSAPSSACNTVSGVLSRNRRKFRHGNARRNTRKFHRKTSQAWFPVTEPCRHCLPCRSCRSSEVVFRRLSCLSENTCFTTGPVTFRSSSNVSCWFKWRQVTRLLVLPHVGILLASIWRQLFGVASEEPSQASPNLL